MLGDALKFTGSSGGKIEPFNKDSMSYGDLASSVKRVYNVAYCSSFYCAGHIGEVLKELTKRYADTCPDCGYTLVYKKRKAARV